MDEANPFDQFNPDKTDAAPASSAQPAQPDASVQEEPNPFDQFNPDKQPENEVSTGGAFAHHAESAVIPTVVGLGVAGAGAEIGAAAGAPFGGVGAVPGAVIGGALGGLAGMFLGSSAGSVVQDWGIHSLPDNWQDALGQSDRIKQLEEQYHPVASFLGGNLPYIVTMSPFGAGKAALNALAPNATALDRIAANPLTARVFGGAMMGGMEAGQEVWNHEKPDWAKIGISTGLGMVFSRPNPLGRLLEGNAARPRAEAPATAEAPTETPLTIAQANAAGVIGEGNTEDTFMGGHQRSPQADMAAQDAVRTEQSVIGPAPPPPDVRDVARSMEPELFTRYDALGTQAADLRDHLASLSNPAEEDIAAALGRRDALQAQLDAHQAERSGYAGGPEARAMRAQIRDAQAEADQMTARQEAFAAGAGVDTPEMTAIRQHIMTTDVAMRDLAPEVSAAMRRAQDRIGSGAVEPVVALEVPTVVGEAAPVAPSPAGPISGTVQEQAAAIAASVTKDLIAAGRPTDEAHAAGQLIAAHTVTRAARMNGVLGSPLDLHNLEGAQIRSAGQPVAEPSAQPPAVPKGRKTPKVQPEVDPVLAKAEADKAGVSKLVTQLLSGATDKEISTLIGGKLSEAQIAGFRKGVGAPVPELTQQPAPKVPEGEMTRQALAEYLRNGGTISGPAELQQRALGSVVLNPKGVPGRDMIGVEGGQPLIRLAATANASTFLHETGHQWLAELMRDAQHPAAGDALKADAETTKKWLGMEGDTIATKQHEKFARGFEQYMREGIAPSPGLASVFAKFRGWLTTIYQTIKGLGVPINDDIRGVFDRFLTETPNRTVIAPEREGQPSLASLHEIDAAHAHPAEAEPIGDRIVAERDQHIAQKPPEVQNELVRAQAERAAAAEPLGEAGAGGEGRGELGLPGGGANAEPASGIGGGERSPVEQGGGTSLPEGANVPAGAGAGAGPNDAAGLRQFGPEPSGSAGPRSTNPLAPEPSAVFGPEPSKFTDKAGNIVLPNLTTNEDVAQAIRDAAQQNNDFIGDRQGRITDAEVSQLADALGMTAESLNRRKLGDAFNAVQIMAARKLLVQSATDVSQLMKKAATGTDEDVMAYAAAKDRHQMIQGQVAGITAEAGRALRAFRNITGEIPGMEEFIRAATGKTLFQLRVEAALGAKLDTPGKVSKWVNDARQRTFGDMLLEYWINGLISGPQTHVTYMVGNTILSLMRAGPETAAAAAIGILRQKTGREGNIIRFGEVPAQLKAIATSAPSALKGGAEALKTGVTTLLPGEKPRSLPFQPSTASAHAAVMDPHYQMNQIMPDLYGTMQGILHGITATGDLIAKGGVAGAPAVGARFSPLGAIPDIQIHGVTALPLGTVARLPSRGIASIHSFQRITNYSMAIAADAYRTAVNEGLSGTARDARIADLTQNPTPDMMERNRQVATDITLMGKGSDFVQALSRLTNVRPFGFPILKFVAPFVHIAGNIIDQSLVQRTPVGIFSPEIRADLMGRNGTIAQDTAQARMLVGTALAMGFGTLASQGLMSGSGPSDPSKSAMWRLAGNQAHSIRIGDVWFDVHRLGPMGMLASVAADMYDVAHSASEGDLTTAGSALLHAFTQTTLDEGFMSGPAELIKALSDPSRYGAAYVKNQIASFVPYSVAMSQFARATDPYARQARSIMDAIKNKIPGQSELLMPRIDLWGNPIDNPRGIGGANITSIYGVQMSRDPVNLAMLQLGIGPAMPKRDIRGVKLDDQQYAEYATLSGRMLKQRLDTIIGSPDWHNWPPETQVAVIEATVSQSRETARGILMSHYPSIAVAATRAKLAPLQRPPIQ